MSVEVRYEVTASVIFSVEATTVEEAEALARKAVEDAVDGFDIDFERDGRVYFDEKTTFEVHDLVEYDDEPAS